MSEPLPDGRDDLSQGVIVTATQRAVRTAGILEKYIDAARDVAVIEPSVMALFRVDYRHLLDDQALLEKLRKHSYEPVEYLQKVLDENRIDPHEFFSAERFPLSKSLFYHGHCQQKTIGSARQTERILRAVGFKVATSEVECCGMAGSFGYKKQFYEVSMAVGQDLFKQIGNADEEGSQRTLVASGISRYEQIQSGVAHPVVHPMEILSVVMPAERPK